MSLESKWPHITQVINSAKGPLHCCSFSANFKSEKDHVGMKNNKIANNDFSMQKSFQQLGQIWWVLGLSDHTSHMWSTVQRGRPAVARYDRVSVIGRPADIYMLTSAHMAGLGLADQKKIRV